MDVLARGHSYVMYLAQAGATYTIPLPFLDPDHIRVFAGDVGDAVEQTFKWIGPTELQLAGQVPEKVLVTIRRFTPRDAAMVTVKDGAQLPASDINRNTQQLLYVVQEQIDFGSGGTGLPGGGAGWPDPGGTPSLPIQQIIDQLMQSPVMQLLTGRIDDIDENAATLLDEIMRSDASLANRHKDLARFAGVETTINVLTDETHSLAQQITDVYAKFDGNAADILEVRQALADEAQARTTAVTRARSDFHTADEAVTTAINTKLDTTYATKDYAQSVAEQRVEAFADGHFAQLQQRFEALVDGTSDPEGSWSANYTMRINGGKIDGVPVIAGIGLGVDSKTGSNFVVMANRFAFVSPNYTSAGGVQQLRYPFVIGMVGGVDTVGIQGQLVVDGSITADKIRVNSLSALTANMGEVNGGTFRTFQLDANGSIINPLEFRVEMTNNPGDAYPMWIGAGVKNWNNAVFAIDRSGNAKFSGTVSAQNIMDNFQVTGTGSWSGDLAADNNGATSTWSLPAPVRLGEYHTPVVMAEIACSSTGADIARGVVRLQQLVGSTWVNVRESIYTLRGGVAATYTIVFFGAKTSSATTYRIALAPGDSAPGQFHMYSTSVYMFGMR